MGLSGWHEALCGVPDAMRAWLLDSGSLTQRICDRCADFTVREIGQRDAPPLLDEVRITGLGIKRHALLREVYLSCNATPVVFAHSVLPYPSLVGRWAKLGRLGNRPLGTALFADPLVRRECMQFRKIDARHPLYAQAAAAIFRPPSGLWARRSLFALATRRILVTEVFLPDILTL